MPTELNKRFCLKGDRKNFKVNFRTSVEDRAAYFGKKKLNEEIIQGIRDSYMMGGQPKKFLYGQYGAGKTHTLFNIKYQLQDIGEVYLSDNYKVQCFFIDAEFRKQTNYNYLHAQMMEALTLARVKNVISEYLAENAGSNLNEKLLQHFGDANIASAVRALSFAGEPISLWKWLCGGKLNVAELNSYNLTKNMDTVAELYRVLVGVMRLLVDRGSYYLFLLDEMEGLKNIGDRDCEESFHDAFRKLADDENDVVGFIMSFYATSEENFPHFICTEDIVSRLNKANIHDLSYLNNENDVRQFLKELFELIIDKSKQIEKEKRKEIPERLEYYPLTNQALDEFIYLATSAPTSSIPRNIISALNEGAVLAYRRNSHVIDIEDLTPAQSIFTESY